MPPDLLELQDQQVILVQLVTREHKALLAQLVLLEQRERLARSVQEVDQELLVYLELKDLLALLASQECQVVRESPAHKERRVLPVRPAPAETRVQREPLEQQEQRDQLDCKDLLVPLVPPV